MRWLTRRTRATCAAPAKISVDPGAVAAEAGPVERQIARRLRPDLRRAGRRGGDNIGHRIARLVIDGDLLGGIARDRLGFGDDQRHRVADMPHHIAGQRRPVAARRGPARSAPASRSTRCRPRPAAYRRRSAPPAPRHAARRGGVDAADRGEGMGRADEHRMRLARRPVVVAEPALPRSAAADPRRAARTAGSSKRVPLCSCDCGSDHGCTTVGPKVVVRAYAAQLRTRTARDAGMPARCRRSRLEATARTCDLIALLRACRC